MSPQPQPPGAGEPIDSPVVVTAQGQPARPQAKEKTIRSFFVGSSGSGSTAAAPAASSSMAEADPSNGTARASSNVPKKRRKKGEDADGQASSSGSRPAQTRLSLGIKASTQADDDAQYGQNGSGSGNGSGNGVWIVKKPDTEYAGSNAAAADKAEGGGGGGRGKGRKKKVAGGEEAELREMSKKSAGAAATGAAAKGKRAIKRKSGVGGDMDDQAIDQLIDPALSTTLPANPEVTSSPPKKKRGRGHTSQATQQQPNSSSIDRPPSFRTDHTYTDTLISSSPSSAISVDLERTGAGDDPGSNGRHRLSNDFEVTSISLASTAASTPTSTVSALPSVTTTSTSKVAHPFFARPNNLKNPSMASSSKSGGSHMQDAIEVEEKSPDRPAATAAGPSAPRKIAFAADQNKPAHSFFARVAAPSATRGSDSPAAVTGGTSRELTSETLTAAAGSEIAYEPSVLGSDRVKGKGKEKETTKEKKNKVHSFFKLATQHAEGKLQKGWGGGIKEGEELIAPLPRGDWPNHDTPSSTSWTTDWTSQYSGPSRRHRHLAPDTLRAGFWESVLETASSSPGDYAKRSLQTSSRLSIPHFIAQHPAFTSLPAKRKPVTSNREPWSDRYRPLRACEVLHNETEATYTRDWLYTLSVGHQHDEPTTRKIVRKVKRGKLKSNLLDGWIVDDLGGFGGDPFPDDLATDEEELEELDEPFISSDPHQRPDTHYPSLESRLTNTILLTGPHGSGKSAAVYAAANELGWDVFEVFPGMGKRTGGNLMGWVGDVGRNHMVSQGQQNHGSVQGTANGNGTKARKQDSQSDDKKKQKGGLTSFFGAGAAKTINKKDGKLDVNKTNIVKLGSQGSAAEPIDIDDENNAVSDNKIDLTKDTDVHIISDEEEEEEEELPHPTVLDNISGTATSGASPGDSVRQSLILLDEADILFDEESTFWPAVVSLIAESRRPVILTCNDHTRIPKDQIPLQAILDFHPPPSYLAMPYLQCIVDQETKHSAPSSQGHHEDAVDIQQIYNASIHRSVLTDTDTDTDDDLIDQPLPPNGNERVPYFDLRKAIAQLQLDRARGSESLIAGESVSTAKIPRDSYPAAGGRNTDELSDSVKRIDNQSYIDAFVELRPWAKVEALEIDRYAPTADDELGPHLLPKPEISDRYPVFVGNDRSSQIALELKRLVGGGVDGTCIGPMTLGDGDLGLARTRYIRSTLPLLDPLIPLSAPLLPNPSLFLYTLPTILGMIEADDLLERAEDVALAHGEERINRKTGRPVRSKGKGAHDQGYMRYLADLGVEGDAEDEGRKLIGLLR
ncbi:hypothetical protein IAU59_006421 [Kwoniella sp. CBS 9459]